MMHRFALAALLAAAAAPASAQVAFDPFWMAREAELRAQQEMDRQRSIGLHNEITALEMRLQTERSLQSLETQARRPAVIGPVETRRAGPATPSASSGGFVEFPADRLAASNERVRAASRPAR
jgi:hypothetical protein